MKLNKELVLKRARYWQIREGSELGEGIGLLADIVERYPYCFNDEFIEKAWLELYQTLCVHREWIEDEGDDDDRELLAGEPK